MDQCLQDKHYLIVCEIGPIREFTSNNRKTIDFWGASFLFSYMMAEVAKKVKQQGARIILPFLDDNPMITGKGSVFYGSVPDQIFILVDGDKKEAIKEILNSAISEIIAIIIEKINSRILTQNPAGKDVAAEIRDFFNFFYIVHEIAKPEPSEDEFQDAEKKIKYRSMLHPFNQFDGQICLGKWNKCGLCGDRQSIHKILRRRRQGPDEEEHICGVCLIKRYLKLIGQDMVANLVPPDYDSTSDIAAIPVERHYSALMTSGNVADENKDNLKKAYDALTSDTSAKPSNVDKDAHRWFFDDSKEAFKNALKDCYKQANQPSGGYPENPLIWLERPFFAVVFLDGDDMNRFRHDPAVSKALACFSNHDVHKIVTNDHGGKVIYCAGDDIALLIHPEKMIDCIEKLNAAYADALKNRSTTAKKMTLSAGAVICHHKFPLSEAIRRAANLLHECAKKTQGKNATAISLIKGHTETLCLTVSNDLLPKIKEIRDILLMAGMSRTTPYRIREQKEILVKLREMHDALQKNYLCSILSSSRDVVQTADQVGKIADCMMMFNDTETMINALILARFLAGDK